MRCDAGGNPIAANRASAYIVLGQIYLLADRDADALKVLRKAQREGKPFWQSSHPELAILDGALGVLAYRARHYDEAEFHTRRALESMEKLLGADHPEVATVARQLASVLKKQKRKDEARDLDARASRILDRRQIDPRVSAWSWRVPK